MGLCSVDQFDFHATLAATPGVALVLFSAPRCGACRHWKQVLSDYAAQQAVTVFVVDVQQDPALAQEFSVTHLPELFLYHQGEYHGQLQAEAHREALHQAIEHCLTLPAEEAP